MITFIIIALVVCLLFFLSLYVIYLMAFYNDQKIKSKKMFFENEEYKPYEKDMKRLLELVKEYKYEEVTIKSKDHKKLCGKEFIRSNKLPIAILFHGYKGRGLVDFSGGLKLTIEMGFDAIVVDQRGHGKSQGRTISFGIKESDDVLAWIEYVKNKYPGREIILEGVSMGATTVLMSLDKLDSNLVKYVIADCPFSTPKDIIIKTIKKMKLNEKIFYPLVKLSALIYGHFRLEQKSTLETVKKTKVPVLLIHGTKDNVVPVEMSEEIKKANEKMVTLLKVDNAPHGLSFVVDYQKYKEKANEMKQKYLLNLDCQKILNEVFDKDGEKNIEDLFEYSRRNYYQKYIIENNEVVAFLFYQKGCEKITSDYSMYDTKYMNRIITNTDKTKEYMKENDIYISLLVVRKDMQNKHLASKLFKEVMKETNCDNVYLWADETCNQGYYNHQGYKALETLNTKAIIYKKTMKNN